MVGGRLCESGGRILRCDRVTVIPDMAFHLGTGISGDFLQVLPDESAVVAGEMFVPDMFQRTAYPLLLLRPVRTPQLTLSGRVIQVVPDAVDLPV